MGQYLTFPQTLARKMQTTGENCSFQRNQNDKIQVITPPINEWHPFIGGYGFNMNPEIDDMIKTTNKLQAWEWFRDDTPPKDKGYTYWNHENVNAISDGLEHNNHSGASFGMCMRQIQFIAGNSWETWNDRNAKWNVEREAKKALEKINQSDPGVHTAES